MTVTVRPNFLPKIGSGCRSTQRLSATQITLLSLLSIPSIQSHFSDLSAHGTPFRQSRPTTDCRLSFGFCTVLRSSCLCRQIDGHHRMPPRWRHDPHPDSIARRHLRSRQKARRRARDCSGGTDPAGPRIYPQRLCAGAAQGLATAHSPSAGLEGAHRCATQRTGAALHR